MANKRRSGPGNQVARHPDRLSIEIARIKGVSLDAIAAKFDVHRDAIARHMAGLDPSYRAALAGDVPIAELAERAGREGGSVMDNLATLQMSLSRAALQAEAAGDRYGHAALSRVWLEATRELGKFTGAMANAPSIMNVTNNVAIMMNSPILHRLQLMLSQRLAPYPDAFDAVMAGLAELEATPLPKGVIDARAA